MRKVREIEPEGFAELWQLWLPHARKTDGRGKARPTYRAWLLSGADPNDILDGARWNFFSMKDEERKYVQLLASYLNSERWVDDCVKWRAHQARIAEREAQRQSERDNVVSIGQPRGQTKFLQEFYAQKAAGE